MLVLLFLACPEPKESAVDDSAPCDTVTFYLDSDGDGFGSGTGATGCEVPAGGAANDTDCDDGDPEAYPGATEVWYDGADQDCDGNDDDQDGDGQPQGFDCDDTDPAIYPGALDPAGDGVDQDCDGFDGVPGGDADGDGYEAGIGPDGDCDDGDPAVNPGADEICGDNIDGNCDGLACGMGSGSLSGAAARYDGTGAGAYIGYFIDGGDTDGDGVAEVLVGSFGQGVWMWAGPHSGQEPVGGADFMSTGSELTLAVALIDESGDGRSEIAVGLEDGNTRIVAILPGEVRGSYDPSTASTLLTGSSSDRLGELIVTADAEGDGGEDFWFGSPGANSDAGSVWIVDGGTGSGAVSSLAFATLTGTQSGESAGWSVASGDVDGDGTPDALVGAPFHAESNTTPGRAYLLHGPLLGTESLSAADATFTGSMGQGNLGSAVAIADTDGDGYGEVIVSDPWQGAFNFAWNGTVYLYRQPAGDRAVADADAAITGSQQMAVVGYSLDSGDFDRDGLADLVVGASGGGALYGQGQIGIFPGPITGTQDFALCASLFEGEAGQDNAGSSVVVAEMSGDGVDDLLVAAPYAQVGGDVVGAVYAVFSVGY